MSVALPNQAVLRAIVAQALEEDLRGGDITSEACIGATKEGKAEIVARQDLVLSGLCVAKEVFAQVGQIEIDENAQDGHLLAQGHVVATISGNARALLQAERVALNFMQRMSGTASLTKEYVDALIKNPDTGKIARIVDTRKTTPLLRPLQRYAVRCGRGYNHRNSLGSAILIKDNHIAACGSVFNAIAAARDFAPHTSRIECEVDTWDKLEEAIAAGADIIMLDNFDDDACRRAVKLINGRAIIEVSGGITISRVGILSKMGVDVISVGALTHSAPAADLAMDWQ